MSAMRYLVIGMYVCLCRKAVGDFLERAVFHSEHPAGFH